MTKINYWVLLFLFICSSILANTYTAKDYTHLLDMPQFSNSLLKMHFKLYQGYVKNTNELLAQLNSLAKAGKTSSYEYGALKRRLGWEFDGMRLHELYFDNLGGSGLIDKKQLLIKALTTQFGSFDQWKRDFIATGLIRGIGWTVLYYDPVQKKLINCWINEHDLGHLATGTPILVMDVFEHAYMPQWGLNRAKYIDAFFANIRWNVAYSRYNQAIGHSTVCD